jgi:hypothetical protein
MPAGNMNKPESFLGRDISRKTRYFADYMASIVDQEQHFDL